MKVELREFRLGDEGSFRALNEAWIKAYFRLEEKDLEILGDPKHSILNLGGHIYFAFEPETEEILGCCALMPLEEGVFEVAKMAVAEPWRGQGIGRRLLRGAIDAARAFGAKRLYLETHHSLKNAIALYESEGFVRLRPEDVPPSPYTRATVFMGQHLQA
jgi:GNAT superfamily N-acetyltransferase